MLNIVNWVFLVTLFKNNIQFTIYKAYNTFNLYSFDVSWLTHRLTVFSNYLTYWGILKQFEKFAEQNMNVARAANL